MIASSERPDWCTPSASRRWWSSRSVRSSSSLSPMTPFIGVRISWLIVARNSDFIREASMARSRAAARAAAARSRSATTASWAATWCTRSWAGSESGDSSASTSRTATTSSATRTGRATRESVRPSTVVAAWATRPVARHAWARSVSAARAAVAG